MDNTLYWLWIQEALGVASRKLPDVLERFGTPEQFYRATPDRRRKSGLFNAAGLARIEKTDLKTAYAQLKLCAELYIDLLTPDDDSYPDLLKSIADPPAVLYVWGHLPDMDRELGIAAVGTRHASEYGCAAAYKLCGDLARAGVVVVSGGANGIDSSCLNGALAQGGRTVCVLGCGINTPYLMGAIDMRRQVAKNGAVISEYPPNAPAEPHHFPIRNRLMSALSRGIVVIEAKRISGALITADHATEQNRDVFAVQGSAFSKNFEGCHNLLREGAIPVSTAADILTEYLPAFGEILKPDGIDEPILDAAPPKEKDKPVCRPRKAKTEPIPPKVAPPVPKKRTAPELCEALVDVGAMSPLARELYEAMTADAAHTADYLCDHTGKPCGTVLAALTELEILGAVTALPGNQYKKIV